MPLDGQGCRLIWFPAPAVEVDLPEFFKHITGEEPDVIRKNRSPSVANPFTAVAERQFSEFNLTLSTQPGRIELVASPDPTRLYSTVPLINLDDVLKHIDGFIEHAASMPLSVRLSCIAAKYIDANTAQEADEIFSRVTGINHGIPEATDQIFQVNRRTSYLGTLSNRVTTANVIETQSFVMQTAGVSDQKTNHGVGITYDFNTVPDGTIYDTNRQKEIFKEMLSSLSDAVHKGDLTFLQS